MPAQSAYNTYKSALDALITDITTTAPGDTRAKILLDVIVQLSERLNDYELKEIIAAES